MEQFYSRNLKFARFLFGLFMNRHSFLGGFCMTAPATCSGVAPLIG